MNVGRYLILKFKTIVATTENLKIVVKILIKLFHTHNIHNTVM